MLPVFLMPIDMHSYLRCKAPVWRYVNRFHCIRSFLFTWMNVSFLHLLFANGHSMFRSIDTLILGIFCNPMYYTRLHAERVISQVLRTWVSGQAAGQKGSDSAKVRDPLSTSLSFPASINDVGWIPARFSDCYAVYKYRSMTSSGEVWGRTMTPSSMRLID